MLLLMSICGFRVQFDSTFSLLSKQLFCSSPNVLWLCNLWLSSCCTLHLNSTWPTKILNLGGVTSDLLFPLIFCRWVCLG